MMRIIAEILVGGIVLCGTLLSVPSAFGHPAAIHVCAFACCHEERYAGMLFFLLFMDHLSIKRTACRLDCLVYLQWNFFSNIEPGFRHETAEKRQSEYQTGERATG